MARYRACRREVFSSPSTLTENCSKVSKEMRTRFLVFDAQQAVAKSSTKATAASSSKHIKKAWADKERMGRASTPRAESINLILEEALWQHL
jgi:hypothetical protein